MIVENLGNVKPILERIDFYTKRLERLREEQKNLVITSSITGLWVAPDLKKFRWYMDWTRNFTGAIDQS